MLQHEKKNKLSKNFQTPLQNKILIQNKISKVHYR